MNAKLRKLAELEADWSKRYLAPLVGATITAVEVEITDDFGMPQVWPTIVAQHPDGTEYRIEVSQDQEGNGPGFLFGLPHVDPSEHTPTASETTHDIATTDQ